MIRQVFVLCADTRAFDHLFGVLWGMAINDNMHLGVTWPCYNRGNTFHEIMACEQAFCITERHHIADGHTAGSQSRKNPGLKFISCSLSSESQFTPQIVCLNFLADENNTKSFSYKKQNIPGEKKSLKI